MGTLRQSGAQAVGHADCVAPIETRGSPRMMGRYGVAVEHPLVVFFKVVGGILGAPEFHGNPKARLEDGVHNCVGRKADIDQGHVSVFILFRLPSARVQHGALAVEARLVASQVVGSVKGVDESHRLEVVVQRKEEAPQVLRALGVLQNLAHQ